MAHFLLFSGLVRVKLRPTSPARKNLSVPNNRQNETGWSVKNVLERKVPLFSTLLPIWSGQAKGAISHGFLVLLRLYLTSMIPSIT